MRISFLQADFDALVELWNTFYPEEFKIDAQILRQNTVESPVFDWGASQIDVMDDVVQGFVALKQPAARLYSGPNKDVSHVSALAFREADSGIDLLAEAKGILRNRGQQILTFGADSRHFFPGCPSTAHTLCSFLMVEGFDNGGECFDLERDLADYEAPYPVPEGAIFRALDAGDSDGLTELLSKEFSGRWRYDVLEKVKVEGPSCVFGVFKGNELAGFSLIQDFTNKRPIGGGVWRGSLGEKWGSLGPIGVVASLRGKGLGHGLLGASLTELKNRGVRRCIIDWTGLTDFYGRHGFAVTRTYQAKSLRLGE